MAVKLRLTRLGRKKRPFYRIVAVDSRRKRDGAFSDQLGYYHPLDNPPVVKIDADKALKWLRVGAEPSDTVRSLLRREGVWYRFRLEKRGLPEAQINQMMSDWFAAHQRVDTTQPAPELPAPAEKPVEEVKVQQAPVSAEAEPAVDAAPAVEA